MVACICVLLVSVLGVYTEVASSRVARCTTNVCSNTKLVYELLSLRARWRSAAHVHVGSAPSFGGGSLSGWLLLQVGGTPV